uniref:Uncharacterized protein n=1 Tax=Aplanochytrium stocchinoi TaxID=215587 RepID=A0A7S3PL90_9STRA|mmetsp:Transcript_2110/g.2702  ORF Transcript_2110/g.2702 Transcript_2110/m.2702 type:complete len:258 (+) Transcript_2110:201-974(+)|eukprot:CAMPEP_0204836670 /NCGR_PEP_ID=MMETSP1346-20131115/25826_1 /ASSEMBLY_ACC=CAM_ASM_000771 /TAXON_ID=215587 /ORGANISM="Aplanochytrium stocchinoi, Strain GSBS06" /LENGTH=257 /DNA_ID=CAMNT_0051971575 /DNA_START=72 /DNA_END=845 /DNA_ORIENTATION=+
MPDVVVVQAKPYSPNVSGGYNPGNENYVEAKYFDEMTDVTVRHDFVRKVYGILTLQLLFTFGMVALFVLNDDVVQFFAANSGILTVCYVISIICIVAIICCQETARKHPQGIILLVVFTIAEGILIGAISAQFEAKEVVVAVGITFAIFFSLSIFACQTKYDFSGTGPYLMVAFVVLILFAIVLIFIDEDQRVRTALSALFVILFSFFIVYDTQLIIGGNGQKYQLEVDEYVFGALSLYLDIINLFLCVLSLLGGDG